LDRRKFNDGASVSALTVDIDQANNFTIIAGDRGGTLTGFQLQGHLYKVRVEDDTSLKSLPQASKKSKLFSRDRSINSLLSVIIQDKFGIDTNYLLVSESSSLLHYYNQSLRVHSLELPSKINTICVGSFQNKKTKQIIAGCLDGFIYLIEDYQVKRYIKVSCTITKLIPFSHQEVPYDYLLCAGHFNALKIFGQGQLLVELKTSDWIQSLAVGDVNNDGKNEIIVGLVNYMVHVFEVQNGTQ